MGFLGDIFKGTGSLASGAGNLLTGIGGISQAESSYAVGQQQNAIQQEWVNMAQMEAQKADQWIQNYASSFGTQDFEGYKWANDFMDEWRTTGKIPTAQSEAVQGRLKQMEEGLGKTYQAGEERLSEQMATRGISKESGVSANALQQYEQGTTESLNQTLASKQTEYENQLLSYAQQEIASSKTDPLFSNYTYNQTTGKMEAKAPNTYQDPVTGQIYNVGKYTAPNVDEFNTFKSTAHVGGSLYDASTGKGWLKDSKSGSWFYVANNNPANSPYNQKNLPLTFTSNYQYGAPDNWQTMIGPQMSTSDYFSRVGLEPTISSGTTTNNADFSNYLTNPGSQLPRASSTSTYKNYLSMT